MKERNKSQSGPEQKRKIQETDRLKEHRSISSLLIGSQPEQQPHAESANKPELHPPNCETAARSEYQKQYYQRNKERIRARRKTEYDQEYIREYHRRYYESHKAEKSAYYTRYYQQHRDEILEQKRLRRQERKEKQREVIQIFPPIKR
jgi:hypothetical protein